MYLYYCVNVTDNKSCFISSYLYIYVLICPRGEFLFLEFSSSPTFHLEVNKNTFLACFCPYCRHHISFTLNYSWNMEFNLGAQIECTSYTSLQRFTDICFGAVDYNYYVPPGFSNGRVRTLTLLYVLQILHC